MRKASHRTLAEPTRSGHWRSALACALGALLCGLLLGGLSAWFLGAVALAGLSAAALTFNFHIPGALVRLFAIGRVAAKYGERLSGHRAALEDQCQRRAHLFSVLAACPSVRLAGWQLGRPQALADYLDDVEDVDYARLRAGLPLMTATIGLALLAGATAWLAPLALPALLAGIGVFWLAARAALRQADPLWRGVQDGRRQAAAALGRTLAALVPLKTEGAFHQEMQHAFATLAQARAAGKAIRLVQARLDLLAGLAGPLMAILVFLAAWLAGARGEDLLTPLFLSFSWLAFGETLQGLARSLLARLRRDHAQARLAETGTAAPDPATRSLGEEGLGAIGAAAMQAVSATHLTRRAPDGRTIGMAVDLNLVAGSPLVLRGPSGCGKTSLLKQIAGWLGEDVLTCDHGRLGPQARRAASMLCLHDAAILSDSLRANCFAPGRSDADLWDALAAVELEPRFAEHGLDGWIAQEQLSLGEAQRLNLARALLSDRPILLLDEPTEHLDADQAERIMARLIARLSDRILVLSSHRPLKGAALRTMTL